MLADLSANHVEKFALQCGFAVDRVIEPQPISGMTLHHIGEVVEKGYWLEEAGVRRPLEPKGYVHEIE